MVKSSIIFFLLLCHSVMGQTKMEDILGKWMATDKSVSVLVYKEGKAIRAKVLWFDEKLGNGQPINSRVDTRNPDPKLRNRKLIGMDILENLYFNTTKQRWENGKIYDASSGRTWDSYAEIKDDGQLIVRGFWKWQWIGKTLYFDKM
ncbi:DUF2147 domain-containing protein [Kaistella flava (ex Peng et al. 2021)]|uniref:DUF2147 domain-containing protein n=2 Tax=Kaistella flava (ex Peng et al. 2021) TaxID=2038776 RepID=A0A7M2Y8V4_9FLAO|nr:DUF2147 domain-containing protein [Kaistella flava (ex Peng et al. 2021)]